VYCRHTQRRRTSRNPIGGVLVKQLIDRSQELLRLIGSNRALAAEIRL